MKKLMIMAALAGAAITAAQGATYKWAAAIKDVANGSSVAYESGEYLPLPDPEPSPSPTPEPTGGVMLAIGAAAIALKRKEVAE